MTRRHRGEPQRAGLRRAAGARATRREPARGEAQPARARDPARRLAQPGAPRADAPRRRGAAHGQAAARVLRRPGDGRGRRRGLRRPARARAPRRRARARARRRRGARAVHRLLDATDAAISHEEWDAANAAFHEFQIDLAGNALLSRFYRELSVNLMMQVIRGGQSRDTRTSSPSTAASSTPSEPASRVLGARGDARNPSSTSTTGRRIATSTRSTRAGGVHVSLPPDRAPGPGDEHPSETAPGTPSRASA